MGTRAGHLAVPTPTSRPKHPTQQIQTTHQWHAESTAGPNVSEVLCSHSADSRIWRRRITFGKRALEGNVSPVSGEVSWILSHTFVVEARGAVCSEVASEPVARGLGGCIRCTDERSSKGGACRVEWVVV